MFWPLHDHHKEGCIQQNTNAADSVEDVHVCSKNTILSIKIATNSVEDVHVCSKNTILSIKIATNV